MTARVLARSHLPQLVPTLFAGHHLVVLVPAAADRAWTAAAAWEFARAAATAERNVLLVDLSLEEPALDGGATNRIPRGIVDAIAADLPLSDVARPQDRPMLHYIGRGTPAPDPASVWSSPRWKRLARGFASEGALLALFVPPAALPTLAVEVDGIVVLAPEGYDPAQGIFPRIAEQLERGTPLLAVVASQGPTLAAEPPPPPDPRPRFRRRTRTPIPLLRTVLAQRPRGYVLLAALSVAATASVFLLSGRRTRPAAEQADRSQTAPAGGAAALPTPVGDTLYYSVQVAAHNTLPQALEHADRLERTGRLAIVTPVSLANRGLWYRVLVGVHPSARAADSALQGLWQLKLLERPQGTILRTPSAFRIKTASTREQAGVEVRGLRAKGIPAYIVPAANHRAVVYVGAFDLPEQARTTDSLLAAAGLTGTLVQRLGIAP
ncbi:MAG: SPOR domain-containing protein [Gemmatimonadetes bacterium]|nr:SPOR domain-containing protein [Gemmatimonadota bacterium]